MIWKVKFQRKRPGVPTVALVCDFCWKTSFGPRWLDWFGLEMLPDLWTNRLDGGLNGCLTGNLKPAFVWLAEAWLDGVT